MRKINFKELPITKEEIESVKETMESGYLSIGPKVFEFEKELAHYVGAKYAIATNSCTAALMLAVKRNNPKIVGLPSMNCPVVPAMIINEGYKLYFYDDPNWVGMFYDLEGTNVVDSAEHLSRNQYKETRKGNVVCFSFYPTKEIGGAEGGAIVTNYEEDARWFTKARNWGRDIENSSYKSWEQEIEFPG
jgi:dTDP-4-amino-4,6-dideoxygalactose transaminase